MALIKCSECSNDVSDKATNCPNCGNPIAPAPNTEPTEYICCPKCGSKELYSNKQGFGAGKAIIGGLVAGPLGLLAGGINSNKVLVTCKRCSSQFTSDKANICLTGDAKTNFDKKVIGIMKSGGGGSIQIASACDTIKKRLNMSDDEAKKYTQYLERSYGFKANRKMSTAEVVIIIVVAILLLVFVFWIFS